MRSFVTGLIFVLPAALFGRVAYLILLTSPPDPAALDHVYRQAAYTITWAIQLAYLAWLVMRWRSQKTDVHSAGQGRPAGIPNAERTGKTAALKTQS
jgi:hypothetical protein